MSSEHFSLFSPVSSSASPSYHNPSSSSLAMQSHLEFLNNIRKGREEAKSRKSKSIHTINSNSLASTFHLSPGSPGLFFQRQQAMRDVFSNSNTNVETNSNSVNSESHDGAAIIPPSNFLPNVNNTNTTSNASSGLGPMNIELMYLSTTTTSDSDSSDSKPLNNNTITILGKNHTIISESTSVDSFLSIDTSGAGTDNTGASSFVSDDDDEQDLNNNSDQNDLNNPNIFKSSQPQTKVETKVIYPKDESTLLLIRKPIQHFIYGGLLQQKAKLVRFEKTTYIKEVQLASKYIINTLLINSWRSKHKEILRVHTDNSHLKLQEDNLGLQLRVIRHLQVTDRERATQNIKECHELQAELSNLQKTEKRNNYELKSSQEELHLIKENFNKLMTDKLVLTNSINDALERKTRLQNQLEAERAHKAETGDLVSKLEFQLNDLQSKIKDLARQSSQWEERTNEYELIGWNMKKKLDAQQKEFDELKEEYQLQHEKMSILTNERESTEDTVEKIGDQLEFNLHEYDALHDVLNHTTEEFQAQDQLINEMKQLSDELKIKNKSIEKELCTFKLKNLRRRRAIVNGLTTWKYIIQFFLFGPEVVINSVGFMEWVHLFF